MKNRKTQKGNRCKIGFMMNELGGGRELNLKRKTAKQQNVKPQNVKGNKKGEKQNVKRARQKETGITCAKVIVKEIKTLTKNREVLRPCGRVGNN